MTQALPQRDAERIKSLFPLHTLPADKLDALLDGLQVQTKPRGEYLFRQGETDHVNVYLLDGKVALLAGEKPVEKVSSGSDAARFPIAHQFPRKYSVRTLSDVRYVKVDSRRLSDVLAKGQSSDYEVSTVDEDTDEDDWMTQVLNSRVLQQIPASNLQAVMMRLEQVNVSAGDVVIRQGDEGDYYFLMNRGRCRVERDMGDGRAPVQLAELGPGTAFGEEALLSDSPRNSTITMLSDGLLLRLKKQDFIDLIGRPLSTSHSPDEAKAQVEQGAVWLDVRSADDYEKSHIPGSVNLPFELLRYQANSLAPDRTYIAYSETGGRAVAAAFLLTERGFDVAVMHGGYADLSPEAVSELSREKARPAESDDSILEEDVPSGDEAAHQLRSAESRVRDLEAAAKKQQEARRSIEKKYVEQAQALKDTVERARRQISSLRDERDQQARDVQRERQKREKVEKAQKAMAEEMAEAKRAQAATQNDKARLEQELLEQQKGLRQRIQELEDNLRQAQSEQGESGQQQEQLQAKLAELEQTLSAEQAKREELKQQQQATLSDADEAQEELQGKINGLEKALQDEQKARKAAEQAQQAASGKDDQVKALTAELDAQRKQVEQLNQDLQAERGRNAELDKECTASLKQLESLRTELATRPTEQEQATNAEQIQRVEALEHKLAEANRQVDELKEQRGKVESECAGQRQLAQGRAQELERTQAQRDSLERELERLKKTNEARDQEMQELRESRAKWDKDRVALREKAADEAKHLAKRVDEIQAEMAELTVERDDAKREAGDLRAVMERYASTIQAIQGMTSENEQVVSLQTELEMVREQANKDVERMRKDLAEARRQAARLSDQQNSVELEMQRQDLESAQAALRERQRELDRADETRQSLEDALEDAHHELEGLRRQLAETSVDAEEAEYRRREEEQARERVQQELYKYQEDAEEAAAVDLRDERIPRGRPLGMGQALGGISITNLIMGFLIGAGILVGGLEAFTYLTGKGELFTFLFGGR